MDGRITQSQSIAPTLSFFSRFEFPLHQSDNPTAFTSCRVIPSCHLVWLAMASTSAATSVLPKLSAHGLLSNAGGLASRCSPHVVSLPALRCRSDQPGVSSTSSTRLGKRRGRVIAMATGETSTDPVKPLTDALKPVQEAWEKTDDKLAVGGLGFAAVIVLWASTGLIAAIDKLPLIPSAFEFVGILFSGWFIYRNLLFKPDREQLWTKIQNAISEITGQ